MSRRPHAGLRARARRPAVRGHAGLDPSQRLLDRLGTFYQAFIEVLGLGPLGKPRDERIADGISLLDRKHPRQPLADQRLGNDMFAREIRM